MNPQFLQMLMGMLGHGGMQNGLGGGRVPGGNGLGGGIGNGLGGGSLNQPPMQPMQPQGPGNAPGMAYPGGPGFNESSGFPRQPADIQRPPMPSPIGNAMGGGMAYAGGSPNFNERTGFRGPMQAQPMGQMSLAQMGNARMRAI